MVAVAATLLFGHRAGIVAVGLGAVAILGASIAHSAGWLTRIPSWVDIVDGDRVGNGARATFMFTLLSASSVVGISYLLRCSEQLALIQTRALHALQQEQLEKERLRRDLESREAALGKARELETLGRLAGSMAHDFNNALLVIWAAIDELTENGVNVESRETIEVLRAAAEHAAATTRNLRAFGMLGPRRPTALQLGALIARAKATLERVLPRNIRLDADVQVDATIAADEGELLRMLTNLSLNARDAMRGGGRLVLRVPPRRQGSARARPTSESSLRSTSWTPVPVCRTT